MDSALGIIEVNVYSFRVSSTMIVTFFGSALCLKDAELCVDGGKG